jgi:hypothetical protein
MNNLLPEAPSIKAGVGTPLEQVESLDENDRRRLAAVSVTTAEELLGIIETDPDGTRVLLSLESVTQLESDAAAIASASAAPSLDRAPDETFYTGATAPDFVGDLTVTLEDIERRAQAGWSAVPADSGSGVDLRAELGPIRFQGKRGTCVAHTVCALVECLLKRDGRATDLTEQYVYWNAKSHDGRPNEIGTKIVVAMERQVADGACSEEVWPYVPDVIPGNESHAPPPATAAADSVANRLAAYEGLKRHDAGAIRAALDAGRPIALSVPVFPNWKGNRMLKLSGFIPMPLPGNTNDGGHAMCAVGYGYDSEFTGGGYLVLRNSWGSQFAPSSPVAPGHALLPFAYWEDYGWEVFVGSR